MEWRLIFFSRYYYNDAKHDTFLSHAESNIIPNKEDHCAQYIETCLRNRLCVGNTDLGSVIWDLNRWRSEKVKFSRFTPSCCHDGMVTEMLRDRNWFIKIMPYCFLSHSPNEYGDCKHDGMN